LEVEVSKGGGSPKAKLLKVELLRKKQQSDAGQERHKKRKEKKTNLIPKLKGTPPSSDSCNMVREPSSEVLIFFCSGSIMRGPL
jgi:hypothetical protein